MSIPLGEVMYFDAVTHDPSTGAVTDADSAPTFEVYEENTDTPILTAQAMTQRGAITGSYRGNVTCSSGNGFEAGKWYSIVAEATVSSTQGKAVAKNFRINVAETTAGTPVVDATPSLNVTTYAEPGQGIPASTASLAAKINYLYKFWRNKKDNDGTETTIYADDATTPDHKQTTTISGGTVTLDEWTTGV